MLDNYLEKKASYSVVTHDTPHAATPSTYKSKQSKVKWVPVTAKDVKMPADYNYYGAVDPRILHECAIALQSGKKIPAYYYPILAQAGIILPMDLFEAPLPLPYNEDVYLKYLILQPDGIKKLHILLSPLNERILPEKRIYIRERLKKELLDSLSEKDRQLIESTYGKPFESFTSEDLLYVMTRMHETGTLPELFKDVEVPENYTGTIPTGYNTFKSRSYGNSLYGRPASNNYNISPGDTPFTFRDIGGGRLALFNTETNDFVGYRELKDHGIFGPQLHAEHALRHDDLWKDRVNGVDPAIFTNGLHYFLDRYNFGEGVHIVNDGDPFLGGSIPIYALKDKDGNIITSPAAYYEYAYMERLKYAAKRLGPDGMQRLVRDGHYGFIPSEYKDSVLGMPYLEDDAKDSAYVANLNSEQHKLSIQEGRQQLSDALDARGIDPREKAMILETYDREKLLELIKGDASQLQLLGTGNYISDNKNNKNTTACCYIVRDVDGAIKVYTPPQIRLMAEELRNRGDAQSLLVLNNINQSIIATKQDAILFEALSTAPENRTLAQLTYISNACLDNPELMLDIVTSLQPGQDPIAIRSLYKTTDANGAPVINPKKVYDSLKTVAVDGQLYIGILNYHPEVQPNTTAYSYNKPALSSYYRLQENYYTYVLAAAAKQMTPRELEYHPLNRRIGHYKYFGDSSANPSMYITNTDTAVKNTPTLSLALLALLLHGNLSLNSAADYNALGSEANKDAHWTTRILYGIGNGYPAAASKWHIAMAPKDPYNEWIAKYYDPKFMDLYNVANTGNVEGDTTGLRWYNAGMGALDALSTAYALQGGAAYNSARAFGATRPEAWRYVLTGGVAPGGMLLAANTGRLVAPFAPIMPVSNFTPITGATALARGGQYTLNGLKAVEPFAIGGLNMITLKNTGQLGWMAGPTKGNPIVLAGVNVGTDFYGSEKASEFENKINVEAPEQMVGITLNILKNLLNTPDDLISPLLLYKRNNGSLLSYTNYKLKPDTKAPDNASDKAFPWLLLLLGAGLAAGGLGLYNLMKNKKKKKKKKDKDKRLLLLDMHLLYENEYDLY